MPTKTRYELEDDQIATLIAALRFYQQHGQGDPMNRSIEIHDLAEAGGDVISLDDDGIEELCQHLNLDGKAVDS